jgi:hypothetical protein
LFRCPFPSNMALETYTFVPASGFFVRGCCARVVTELDFKQLGEVLLVSGGTAEVAFAAVVRNGLV